MPPCAAGSKLVSVSPAIAGVRSTQGGRKAAQGGAERRCAPVCVGARSRLIGGCAVYDRCMHSNDLFNAVGDASTLRDRLQTPTFRM